MEETRKKKQVSGGSEDRANIPIIKKFCLDLNESVNKSETETPESQPKCRLTVGKVLIPNIQMYILIWGSGKMATIAANMEHSGL